MSNDSLDLEKKGRSLIDLSRQNTEMVTALGGIIETQPESGVLSPMFDHLIERWQLVDRKNEAIAPSLTDVNSFVAISGAASTASGTLTIMTLDEPDTASDRAKLGDALKVVRRAHQRPSLVDRGLQSISRLGLDRQVGQYRTPDDLLRIADKAYRIPSTDDGGLQSCLIGIRECIDSIIARLLQARPRQEPAKNMQTKITSIGQQLGRDGLETRHFIGMGCDASRIWDELSKAKQAHLTQEDVKDRFFQGLSLANAILDSIDETKVRRENA